MYTYEPTPNLKSKSYRILEDGIEYCRNLTKKTAYKICESLNLVKDNQNVKLQFGGSDVNQDYRSYPRIERESKENSTNIRNSHPILSGDSERVSGQRQEYIANTLIKLSADIEGGVDTSNQHGELAIVHDERAKVHSERAIIHGERVIPHRELAIQHGDRAIIHGERANQHDERAKVHAQNAIQHGERAKVHDELAIIHAERSIQHRDRAIEYGERAIEYGERANQHAENARICGLLIDHIDAVMSGSTRRVTDIRDLDSAEFQGQRSLGGSPVIGQNDSLSYRTIDTRVERDL